MQDDESGLVYMRSRYYEPESGRFISEDKAMDGKNWFVYCNNNPIAFNDISGKLFSKILWGAIFWIFDKFFAELPIDNPFLRMARTVIMAGIEAKALWELTTVAGAADSKTRVAAAGLRIGGVSF